MKIRSSAVAILGAAAIATTSAAQQRPARGTAPAPTGAIATAARVGAVGQVNPAVANLQTELAALNLLNSMVGSKKSDSSARIEQMQAFMAAQKLDGDFATFKASTSFSPVSFNQAYQAALDQVQLSGPPESKINDLDTLVAEVQATTTMVHQSWDQLNQNLAKVQAMTEFLDRGGKMNDYLRWSAEHNAEQKQQEMERLARNRAAADAAARARIARGDRNIQELQKKLDSMPYSTGIDYNYTFSQGVQPGSQTGYYGGTFFNGYADPYYDIWNANTHLNFGQFGPQSGWWGSAPGGGYDVNAWNRTAAPVYRSSVANSVPHAGR